MVCDVYLLVVRCSQIRAILKWVGVFLDGFAVESPLSANRPVTRGGGGGQHGFRQPACSVCQDGFLTLQRPQCNTANTGTLHYGSCPISAEPPELSTAAQGSVRAFVRRGGSTVNVRQLTSHGPDRAFRTFPRDSCVRVVSCRVGRSVGVMSLVRRGRPAGAAPIGS